MLVTLLSLKSSLLEVRLASDNSTYNSLRYNPRIREFTHLKDKFDELNVLRVIQRHQF